MMNLKENQILSSAVSWWFWNEKIKHIRQTLYGTRVPDSCIFTIYWYYTLSLAGSGFCFFSFPIFFGYILAIKVYRVCDGLMVLWFTMIILMRWNKAQCLYFSLFYFITVWLIHVRVTNYWLSQITFCLLMVFSLSSSTFSMPDICG